MTTLNTIGKKTKRSIVAYLKDIKEYRKVEEGILIDSTALSYQLYVEFQEEAQRAMEEDKALGLKFHALALKYYDRYINNLKSLGISAIQRKKLALSNDDDAEESIFDKIAQLKEED